VLFQAVKISPKAEGKEVMGADINDLNGAFIIEKGQEKRRGWNYLIN